MKISELLKQELVQKEISVYRIAQLMKVNYKTLNARINRNVLTAEELFTICNIFQININELYNKYIIDEYLVLPIYDEDTIDQNKFLATLRIISKDETESLESPVSYVLSTNDGKSYHLTKTNFNYFTNKSSVFFKKNEHGLFEIDETVQRPRVDSGRYQNEERTSTASGRHPNVERTSTSSGRHPNEGRTSTALGHHPNEGRTSTTSGRHLNEETTSSDSDRPQEKKTNKIEMKYSESNSPNKASELEEND